MSVKEYVEGLIVLEKHTEPVELYKFILKFGRKEGWKLYKEYRREFEKVAEDYEKEWDRRGRKNGLFFGEQATKFKKLRDKWIKRLKGKTEHIA